MRIFILQTARVYLLLLVEKDLMEYYREVKILIVM